MTRMDQNTFYKFHPETQTMDLLSSHLQEAKIEMRDKSVGASIGEQYKKWHFKDPVFIDAPTGSGKTTFVYDVLLPDVVEQGGTLLLISNRIALSEQQKNDVYKKIRGTDSDDWKNAFEYGENLRDAKFIGPVCITTYQGLIPLFNRMMGLAPSFFKDWLFRLKYVVMDEVHFIYSDALFNSQCSRLLEYLPVIFQNAIRIYMTATSWEIKESIFLAEVTARHVYKRCSQPELEHQILFSVGQKNCCNETNPHLVRTFYYYHGMADYSAFHLDFFTKTRQRKKTDQSIETAQSNVGIEAAYFKLFNRNKNQFPSKESRWLIFIDNKEEGRKLQKIFRSQKLSVAYLDAEWKDPEDIQETLATTGSFDEDILIATSVIDCGININREAKVNNIVISSTDRTSFIQMLGRRRLGEGDSINLWVYVPSKNYLLSQQQQYDRELKLALELMEERWQGTNKYVDIARKIWRNRKRINTESLFYIDSTGFLNCNLYVADVLRRRILFLQQFTEHSMDFKGVVREWLGKKEESEEKRKQMRSELIELLEAAAEQPIPEQEVSPLRHLIIEVADSSGIATGREDRKGNFAPQTLNRLLQKLGIDYVLEKKAKIWSAKRTTM